MHGLQVLLRSFTTSPPGANPLSTRLNRLLFTSSIIYSWPALHAVPPRPGVPVQVLLGGRPQPQVGPHLRLAARLPRDRVELAHLQLAQHSVVTR